MAIDKESQLDNYFDLEKSIEKSREEIKVLFLFSFYKLYF